MIANCTTSLFCNYNSNIKTMDEGQTRLSHSRSLIKRRHNQLTSYLTNEMGLDPLVASTLLHLHKPTSLRDALDLFVINENGLINHYFIRDDEPNQQICRICEGHINEHRESNENQIKQQWSQQVQQSSVISSDKSEDEGVPKKSCQICYIEVAEEDMIRIKGTVHDICIQCMEMYLKEEIGSMRVQGLSCPHCQVPIPNGLIEELVDRPTYNKYRQFLRNLEIHTNPNLKWCPNPKCSIVINTTSKKKTSKCPKCATMICNKCNREAHPKSSCDAAFKKEIKDWENAKDMQKCKKCLGLVEKIAGCNHMTCSVCQFEWCWLCGSQFSNTHFSPLNPFGCPGLQDRQRDEWSKCRILMLRIGILTLLFLGSPLILPLVMIAVGPVLIMQMLYDCLYPDGCCKKTLTAILGIILGTIANPLVWVGCVLYFIPKGIMRLCAWYKQRRLQQQHRNNFLQERLLGEQPYDEQPIE